MSTDIHFRKRYIQPRLRSPASAQYVYEVFVDTTVGRLHPGRVSRWAGAWMWVVGGNTGRGFNTRREATEALAGHIKPELRL